MEKMRNKETEGHENTQVQKISYQFIPEILIQLIIRTTNLILVLQ